MNRRTRSSDQKDASDSGFVNLVRDVLGLAPIPGTVIVRTVYEPPNEWIARCVYAGAQGDGNRRRPARARSL